MKTRLSTPVNRNLQQAQADYAAAANDPQVRSLAPTALHDAQVALERSEQAQRESRSREEVDHLAYLASRRAEIARVSAQRNANVAAAPPVVVVERKVETVETVPVVPRTTTSTESRVEVLATELAAALQDLRTRRGERGLVVSVEDVLFEPERATLHADALADLARLADFLHAHPELEVQIEGHSDLSESDQLSIARARAVESYLVMRGVEATRISTVAHGDHDPIASSTTAVGRQQNRRVEIVLLD